MNILSYEEIKVGDIHSFERLVDEKMVNQFAELTGDHNPLHTNEEYAKKTMFGSRIAHGMLLGSFFSTLVGMFCPGKYALYLSQELTFRNPLKIGSRIKVRGEVIAKSDATKTITLATTITDETGKVIVDGRAMVKVGQNHD